MDTFPLSPAQHALLLDQLLHGNPAAFNVAAYWDLPLALDPALFCQALRIVVQETPSLRIGVDPEHMVQFETEATLPLPVVDLRHEAAPLDAAVAFMRMQAAIPFALDTPPLARSLLLRIGHEHWLWFVCAHHIIVDGWSFSLLGQRLYALYEALSQKLPLPPAQFRHPREFLALQHDAAHHAEGGSKDFWATQLKDLPPALFPPSDSQTSAAFAVSNPASLWADIQRGARRTGASVFHVCMAAQALLLQAVTGQHDFFINTTLFGRTAPQFLCPALFATSMPARFQLDAHTSLATLAEQTAALVAQIRQHQHMPHAALNAQTPGRLLAQAAITFLQLRTPNKLFGTPLSFHRIFSTQTRLPFVLSIQETIPNNPPEVVFEIQQNCMSAHLARTVPERFAHIVQQVTHDPHLPLKSLDTRTAEERTRLFGPQRCLPPRPVPVPSLYSLFAEAVQANPERAVLTCGGETLGGRELSHRAARISALLRAHAIQPGQAVGVCMPPSGDLAASILGVCHRGCAFVPLPANAPRERIHMMAEDAHVPIVLTSGPMFTHPHIPAIDISAVRGAAPAEVTIPEPVPVGPDDPAYILFTSGTTGRPKGVEVSHRAIVHKILATRAAFGPEYPDQSDAPPSLLPITASCGFDPFIMQLFVGLISAKGALLLTEAELADPVLFWETVRARKITWLNSVPSLLWTLLDFVPPGVHLRRIICGGEAFSRTLAVRLRELFPEAEIINAYGPTEATIDALAARISPYESLDWPNLPIGTALEGYHVVIVDQHQRPTPDGVPGELYIGGIGLAKGYINRPEQTAQAFVTLDLEGRRQRYYRTGDLVCWGEDGQAQFLGRKDAQLKINGVRIEAEDIENALNSLPGIQRSAVIAEDVGDGRKRLAAYCQTEKHTPVPAAGTLRHALQSILPGMVIPSILYTVDSLPHTPSGKLDRAALHPGLAWSKARKESDSTKQNGSGSSVEHALEKIWRDVLGRKDADEHTLHMDASFFECGGTSLLLMTLHQKLRTHFPHYALSLPQLLEHNSIRAQARILEENVPASDHNFPEQTRPAAQYRPAPREASRSTQHTAQQCTDFCTASSAAPGQNNGASRCAHHAPAPGQHSAIFLFSGQGSQYPGMGKELYENIQLFRDYMDECARGLAPHLGLDIREVIWSGRSLSAMLRDTELAQPALFAVEFSLARLWMAKGISPEMMLGHSIGEYCAACLAGVFCLEDALGLVAMRGQLMGAMEPGAMLAVPLDEATLRQRLPVQLDLAVVNGATRCVVAGPDADVEAFAAELKAEGVQTSRLHTSHAFHSAAMEPMLAPFRTMLNRLPLHAPQLPFISNVTGMPISAEQATNGEYWVQHLRATVLFHAGLDSALSLCAGPVLEIGPGDTLTRLAAGHPKRNKRPVLHSLPHPKAMESATERMAQSSAQLCIQPLQSRDAPMHHHAQASATRGTGNAA